MQDVGSDTLTMDTRSDAGPLAFVVAMPIELRPLARKLGLRSTRIGALRLHSGTLSGRDVVAIVTGIGLRSARAGTERVLEAVEVAHVVVAGITGAVESVTPIGTLILPEVVVNGATGREYRPAPLGTGKPRGKMWTADELITDPDTLAQLRARGVVALDMESAAVAEVCERRRVPWSVFRAISDRATDGSVNQEVFGLSNRDGTPNGPAIVRYFVKHPTGVPRMARLARGAKLATVVAAEAAIRACGEGA
jgi:adenosylhomocysteine nucleosidase